MKTNRSLLIASGSALAAGVAQGAVHYSGILNTNVLATGSAVPARGADFDLNNDGLVDFYLGYDGYSTVNHQKPFIAGYPTYVPSGSAVLGRAFTNSAGTKVWFGLPVTPFGTTIDQNYLAPDFASANNNQVYFNQDGDGEYIGDWVTGARSEGYVGLEVFDTNLSTTNYGWAHVIYNDTLTPSTLTLVDYAYEDGNLAAIVAGSTNLVGAPAIYVGPQSQSVPIGVNVQLAVLALANPAPAYQWKASAIGMGVYTNLSDGGAISGSTTATLSINGATFANMLDYIVVITNTLGRATSSPATLTVVTPAAQPSPQALYGRLTARFKVNVSASLSATFRWRKGGANLADGGRISGSGTTALVVSNLQDSDAGNYDIVMNFGSLSVTSSPAQLTVLPPSSESIYEAAVLAARPLAYYRLNETGNPTTTNIAAYDNAGAYNGVYGLDVTNGFAGVAGPRPASGFPGFAANNLAASFTTNDPESRVSLAAWNLHTNFATFTAWINPADTNQSEQAGVVMTGTTNGSFAGMRYYYQTNATTLTWDLGYAWEDGTSASLFWDSGLFAPPNQWSFVGLVVTSNNATIYVFNANGMTSAISDGTANFPPFAPYTNVVMGFETPEYIGTNPDGPAGTRNFNGLIDEVAVFNRAMSQSDLQVLYNAALGTLPPVTLQASRSGSNIQLTWGTLGQLLEAPSITGPWTTNSLASSPYAVPATGSQKFYRVLVH